MKKIWSNIRKQVFCALFLIAAATVLPTAAAQAKNIVIVLDPGHGGGETGATRTWSGKTYREEVLNQKIAQYAKQELETYEGVDVYLTRNSLNDPAMDRSTRVNIAKEKNATALVSIHLNSTADDETDQHTGAFAYVPSKAKYPDKKKYAKNARALGTAILGQLNAQVGIKANGQMNDDELGIILYGMKAKIPSMIIEHCFVNNPSDCKKYLKTEAKLKKIGVADATGIALYYKLTKKGSEPAEEPQPEPEPEPVLIGWQTNEGGGRSYYDENGELVRSKWMKIDGKYYYFDGNGKLKTGVFKIGGKKYLSNADGVRQKGLVTYNKRLYFARSDGSLYIGRKKYKGKVYYFSPKTCGAYLGLKTIGKYKYFFNKKTGVLQTGWVKVSGKKLYFNPKNGRMKKNCWITVAGKRYYLSSNGTPYTDVTKVIKGVTYEFDSQGVCINYL